MKKKAFCKTQNLYILLVFLLITIALLIAVSVYWYLINHRAKQKHLLLFYIANNKPKEKMSNKFEEMVIKKHAYYFFDDTINMKNVYPNKIKIYKKSYKIFLFTTLDM